MQKIMNEVKKKMDYETFKAMCYEYAESYEYPLNRGKLISMLSNGNDNFQAFFKAILIASDSTVIEFSYLKEWFSRFETGNGPNAMDYIRRTIYQTIKKL